MAQKEKLTGDFNELLLDLLQDPDEAQEYLNAALEDGDIRVFLVALRDVAKAHGMTKIAKHSDLDRGNIYRSLSAKGNPSISSLVGILDAVGLGLQITSHSSRPKSRNR